MFRSPRTARLRVGLVAATAATLVTGTAVMATNAQAAAGCRVTYTTASQWPGGFTANVDVTNLGDPINGWNLRWTFPSGQRVTQAWSATVTSSGADVTATNVGYNGAVATNGSVSFGFNGSWSGANTAPTAFSLNGVACTGGGVVPPTPPVQATPFSENAVGGTTPPPCSPAGTSATPSTRSAPTRPPGATRGSPRRCSTTSGRRASTASASR
ncbi:cellulose-binding domain-containing protein [Micromonospora tulbaghiae]|uniref:cellulose-binding domain-containing protein n=1 Tax=Micromonospora tulbaghiae TaxID=479978 RepID=UPI001FC9B8F5|nr:cellulose-binding domain-containing protein [Micromonospora tulbaghiae]